MWQGFTAQDTGGLGVLTGAAGRQSDLGTTFWTLTTTGVPPAGNIGVVYKGRAAFGLTNNTANGYTASGGFITAGLQRSLGNVPFLGNHDWACWEFSAILAYDALPGAVAATGEVGLVIGAGNNTRPMFATGPTQAGIVFGPTNTGVMSVRVRTTDAGAVALNQNVTAPTDMTEWHRYAIRIISASGTNEAQCKFLVDGVTTLQLQWGAGTVLPDQINTVVSPRMGFTCALTSMGCNAATTRMYVADNSVTVCAAPTEDALA
jgi:hypothetical protein